MIAPLVFLYLNALTSAGLHVGLDATVLDYYAEAGIPITAHVVVASCGEQNAYYSRLFDTITLCTELAPIGDDGIRFVVAHEMAHAAVAERGLPGIESEAGADELATLVLELNEDRGAVTAGAEFMMSLTVNPGPDDPHPPNMPRARSILCLDDGADEAGVDPNCRVYFRSAVAGWTRLFAERRDAE